MIRKIFVFCLAIVLTASSLGLASGTARAESPAPEASAVFLADVKNGTVLLSQNENAHLPMAGLCKLMTGLLAIEAVEMGKLQLSDVITVPSEALEGLVDGCTDSALVAGEELSLESLLNMCMLESACDAANAIAIAVSGSVESFVQNMNARAQTLDCTGTSFTNPHCTDDADQYTTATDMFRIANEAFTHKELCRICGSASCNIGTTNASALRRLSNTCQLLDMTSRYYNANVTAGKTGSSSAAGQCVAVAASSGDVSLIAVILGDNLYTAEDGSLIDGALEDAGQLVSWALTDFSYRELLSSGTMLQAVPVELGDGVDSVMVHPAASYSALMSSETAGLEPTYDIHINNLNENGAIMAPIEAGDILGEVTVSCGSVTYTTVDLVAAGSVALAHEKFLSNEVSSVLQQKWLRQGVAILLGLVAVYLLYVVIYNVVRIRKRKKAREQADARIRAMQDQEKTIRYHEEKDNSRNP